MALDDFNTKGKPLEDLTAEELMQCVDRHWGASFLYAHLSKVSDDYIALEPDESKQTCQMMTAYILNFLGMYISPELHADFLRDVTGREFVDTYKQLELEMDKDDV